MNLCCHTPKTFFLTENVENEAGFHKRYLFIDFENRGWDFTMLKFMAPSRLRSGVPLRD